MEPADRSANVIVVNALRGSMPQSLTVSGVLHGPAVAFGSSACFPVMGTEATGTEVVRIGQADAAGTRLDIVTGTARNVVIGQGITWVAVAMENSPLGLTNLLFMGAGTHLIDPPPGSTKVTFVNGSTSSVDIYATTTGGPLGTLVAGGVDTREMAAAAVPSASTELRLTVPGSTEAIFATPLTLAEPDYLVILIPDSAGTSFEAIVVNQGICN